MKNKLYKIDNMEKCTRFLDECRERRWQLWQMQYRYDDPEGFHAWFMKAGELDIEIVTHNEDVQEAIVNFNAKK